MSAGSVFDVHNGTSSISPREAAKLATRAAADYYARVNQFHFNPLRSFDQFLILCALVGLCLALVYYWRQVLKCITGEDHISMDRFSLFYWGVLQCCGCCDGEWTRCFSAHCCCCAPSIRGRNLKRFCGESLGIFPVAIRVQNIVVGSLPQDRHSWFPRSPDLFVQVVADESSPMLHTEVVSEANTECTQFTSSLTLLVKNNYSDEPVRFIVKQMHLTSSSEVADCSVNPARLVKWARRNRKLRIQLGGLCRRRDPLCMPWILLDLSIPPEAKYLSKEVGIFTPVISATAERAGILRAGEGSDDDEEEVGSPGLGSFCGQKTPRGFVDLPLHTLMGFAAVTDATVFKDAYPLVNDKGAEVEEERDMAAQALLNTRSCANIAACWVLLLVIPYLLLRIFTSVCLEEYKQLEAIRLYSETRGVDFRPEEEDLRDAVDKICHFSVLSQEVFKHIIHVDSQQEECFPPLAHAKCMRLQNTTKPWVSVLPCPARVCSLDNRLEDSDLVFLLVLLVGVIAICLGKAWEDHALRREVDLPPKKRSKGRISSAVRGLRSPLSGSPG